MKIALIYLGRRGAGGPISLELSTHLSSLAEVLPVISTGVENRARWQEVDLPRLEVRTYRSFPAAMVTWLTQVKPYLLARRIRSWGPDVLLFPMFHTWAPFLQWYLRPIPSVFTVHDPHPHPGLFDWLDSRFQNLSIRQATRCIIHSENLHADLERRGVAPDAIDVVPLGELSYYQKLSTPLQRSPPQTTTLLFFGRITPYKGLRILLRAFRALNTPQPVRLRIVGAGDFSPYEPFREGLENVEVVNRWIPEEEVGDFFREASILVLPYTSATQSGVLALAAGFGLPVIATKVGGIPEQIVDGETGVLVPPRDVAALTRAMKHLIEQPDHARKLGENLRQWYQTHGSWAHIARMIYQVCQKAVERASAGRPQPP